MKKSIFCLILLASILRVQASNTTNQLDSLESLLRATKNDTTRANILVQAGTIYMDNGNYPKAVESFLAAKRIFDAKNNKYGIFDVGNRLGVTYSLINDYKTSLDYLLNLKMGIDDGRIYDNLALVYYKKADYESSLLYYKKALIYYTNKSDTSFIAEILNGIGSIYELKNKSDTAISYYKKSLKMAERLNDKILISDSYASLGDIYFRHHNYSIALENEKSSLKYAKEVNSLLSIRETEKVLSDIYLSLNDCNSALIHYKKYIEIKDALINENNIKKIVRIEENSKFQKEKELAQLIQQKKDAIKAEELQHQKTQRNIFIGSFAIVLCISFFLFLTFKKTQRQKNVIERQKKMVEEGRKEIEDNIHYSKRIQDAVMTPLSKIQEFLPNSFNLNIPRDTVSGDFLFAEKHNHEIIVAVADCTNHSVSGAMMSLLCHNLLSEAIASGNNIPSDILNYINIEIAKKFHQTEHDDAKMEMDIVKDGMDVIVLKLDLQNLQYQYAGAYNPLLLVRENCLMEIKADKLQLGQTKMKYKNNEGKLQKGDVLFLSSDGYADQFSSMGKKFMKKKFKELLVEINQKPIKEQKSILETTISSWKNGCPQTDDILVMGIKI